MLFLKRAFLLLMFLLALARLPLFEGWEAAKVFIFSKGIAKVFTTNWIAAGVFPLVHSA